MKILLVEDDAEFGLDLLEVLTPLFPQVSLCSSARDAIHFMEKNSIDLLITDISMRSLTESRSDIAGFYLALANGFFPPKDSQTIVMTGNEKHVADLEFLQNYGVDYCLIKPFEPVKLLELVKSVKKELTMRRKKSLLAQKQKEMQISSASVNRSLANVAHDLKTPLRQITTFVDFCKEDISDGKIEAVGEGINTIGEIASRAGEYLNSLLNEMGYQPKDLVFEELDLYEVVADLKRDFTNILNQHQIQFTVNQPLGTAITNKAILQRVIENILSNCAKYFDPKKSEHSITLSRIKDNEEVILEIVDNGLGFESEEVKVRFKRVGFSAGNQDSSHGMGLKSAQLNLEKILEVELKSPARFQ